MDFALQGKVAMVAAGTKGIGRACAEALAKEGCRVSVCARNRADDPIPGVLDVRADVSRAQDIESWFKQTEAELGPADILVTNTGGPPAGAWAETTDEQWQAGVESTLLNVLRMSRLAAPGMVAKGWGRIVHLTSYVAVEPHELLPISSTLRAGLRALVRLQASDLGRHGVTVNAVLPGNTLTDRQTHLADARAAKEGTTRDEALTQAAQAVPLGRLASPDEIAAVVAFLCSGPASYVNGVSLVVDGGLTKGLS